MKLYFIAAVAQDDITNNLDLFVWANSHTEAEIYWRNYYAFSDGERPDGIHIVPCDRPDGQRPGALCWGTDIRQVGLEPIE